MSDWPPVAPQRVTALPSNPYDGQEIYFVADDANGVVWHLRYNAASASAYKWEFLGGGSLTSEFTVSDAFTSSTYADGTNGTASVTLPAVGGDFVIEGTVNCSNTTTAVNGLASVKLGAAATSDNDRLVQSATMPANSITEQGAGFRRNGLAASSVLKIQCRNAGTGSFAANFRRLVVTPIRVG